MRVLLCQRKKGLPAFTERSMKSTDRRTSSVSISSMLVLAFGSMFGCGGRGPASAIFCFPTFPQRGSVVGSSTLVALASKVLAKMPNHVNPNAPGDDSHHQAFMVEPEEFDRALAIMKARGVEMIKYS